MIKKTKSRFIAYFLLLAFAGSFLSLIPSSPVSAANGDQSFYSDQVAGKVLDHQLYYFLSRCFLLKDMDKVTHDEVLDWAWFNEGNTNGDIKSGGLGVDEESSVRGDMYEDSRPKCDSGARIQEAFGRFGYDKPDVTFCSLGFTYNTETGGLGGGSGGRGSGSSYEACMSGFSSDKDFDGYASYSNQLKALDELLSKSSNYAKAKGPLTPVEDYFRTYWTFINGCDIKLVEPYKTGSASGNDELYKIKIVNQDGSSEDWLGKGLADRYTAYYVATLDKSWGKSMTCGQLATASYSKAPLYAEYMKTVGKEDTGSVGGSSTNSESSNSPDQCDAALNNPLTWLVCPLVDLMQAGLDSMDSIIRALMFTPIEDVFTDETRQTATVFRNMALALVVIAGLVMVISQAIGVQILDAYTIKRVFPRLFIAGIGIALSYPLLLFFIGIFNDFGIWGHDLVIQAFGVNNVGSWQSVMNGLLLNGAVAAGAFIYGPAMLTFLLTALLAMLIGVVVLALRQLIIIIAVLMAPLAIACYILPGTQKVWEFWKGAILTALLAFPIITMFLAAGKGLSGVLNATSNSPILHIMALFVYIAPYFLIPFAFKLAGGLMSTVFSMANDSSRGGFDRLKNMRGNSAATRHKDRMEGNTPFGTGRTGRAYRRAATGNVGLTARQRRNFGANERIIANRSAAAALEADGGRAVGNDDATQAAVHATNARDFTSRYLEMENNRRTAQGKSVMNANETAARTREAATALGELESGLGAEIGTSTMRVAAFKARTASSTAYSGDEAGTAQRINEGAELINAGLITSADATAAGKGNRARLDISGNGFGAQMNAFDDAAKQKTDFRNGVSGATDGMTTTGAAAYLDQTLGSAEPGDLLAGNNRTIEALAPRMTARLNKSIEARDLALASAATHTAAGNTQMAEQARQSAIDHDTAIDRSLGQIAGVQDNLNRTSPDKAALFADLVMGVGLIGPHGRSTTVREAIETATNKPAGANGQHAFLEVRKEYGTASRAQAVAANTPPPQTGP